MDWFEFCFAVCIGYIVCDLLHIRKNWPTVVFLPDDSCDVKRTQFRNTKTNECTIEVMPTLAARIVHFESNTQAWSHILQGHEVARTVWDDAATLATPSSAVERSHKFRMSNAAETRSMHLDAFTAVYRLLEKKCEDMILKDVSDQTYVLGSGDVQVTFDRRDDLGASAGLVFALSLYDFCTGGKLMAGIKQKVSATGGITHDGQVTSMGFIRQKIETAELCGIDIVMVCSSNYETAKAHAKHVQIHSVDTLRQAIDFLKSLSQ